MTDEYQRQTARAFLDLPTSECINRENIALLAAVLEAAVPLEIHKIRRAAICNKLPEGPTQEDFEFVKVAVDVLASQGDDLMYKSRGGTGKRPQPYETYGANGFRFTPAFVEAMERAATASGKEAKGAVNAVDLSTGELCTVLIRALAIMSFMPGGVACLGVWFSNEREAN